MKTANEILFEHSIDTMSLNDDFNSQLLNAMERYAEEYHNEKSASLKPNKLSDNEIQEMAENYGCGSYNAEQSFKAGYKAALNKQPATIGDSIDKFKWSELEKIASPEEWIKMYEEFKKGKK